MKTWLTANRVGNSKHLTIFRQFEDGAKPDWIGDLFIPTSGEPSFYTTGESRVFTRDEMKQISVWLDEMTD